MWQLVSEYGSSLWQHIYKYTGIYTTSIAPIVVAIFLYKYSFRRKNSLRRFQNVTEVLFFTNTNTNNSSHDHYEKKCRCEDCSIQKLKKLIDYINAAKVSLDVCVFTISSHELGCAILKKYKEGVRVRVITDLSMWMGSGSQIPLFKQAGILVRTQPSEHCLMHHKFAIVDNELLINGSFNWTAQAVFTNWENITITSVPESLVKSYSDHFNAMWSQLLN